MFIIIYLTFVTATYLYLSQTYDLRPSIFESKLFPKNVEKYLFTSNIIASFIFPITLIYLFKYRRLMDILRYYVVALILLIAFYKGYGVINNFITYNNMYESYENEIKTLQSHNELIQKNNPNSEQIIENNNKITTIELQKEVIKSEDGKFYLFYK